MVLLTDLLPEIRELPHHPDGRQNEHYPQKSVNQNRENFLMKKQPLSRLRVTADLIGGILKDTLRQLKRLTD